MLLTSSNASGQSAQLINDFTVYGTGGTFVNAASVGALALILVYFASVNLSGPTLATILTMIGFSFFGTTPLNSIPIIVGVYLASRYSNQSFGSFSIIALFGTAIGPVVTFIIFTTDMPLMFHFHGVGRRSTNWLYITCFSCSIQASSRV